MNVETYDFRKPLPLKPALSSRLESWLREASRRGPRHWSGFLTLDMESEFRALEILPREDLIARLSETSVRFRVGLGDGISPALLILTRPLLLTLLSGLLNEPLDAPTSDRDLTAVEEALVEYVVRRFFLEILQETWPFPGEVKLEVQQRETQRSTGVSGPDARLVVLTSRLRGAFGDHEWLWALPRSAWLEGLAGGEAGQQVEAPLSSTERELLVKDLPVRLTIQMGTVELSLLQVAQLEAGDVILLDQQIAEPLTALLGDRVKFHVWPGAVGPRQAIEIHSFPEL